MAETQPRRFERLWSVTFLRSSPLLLVPIAAMVGLGMLRGSNELGRLLYDPGRAGAIDLKILVNLVHSWFSGMPMYGDVATAVHPPATYLILWPIYGWLDTAGTRWWYLFLSLVGLGLITYRVGAAVRGHARLEQLLLVLVPVTTYSTWATLGNGQLTLLLMAVLLAVIPALASDAPRRHPVADILLAAGLIFTLSKPQFSAPFFWLAVWWPRGLRAVAAAGVGYALLTLVAAGFQDPPLPALLHQWLASAQSLATQSAGHGSFANLHAWLAPAGLDRWALPASAVLFTGLGVWSYRQRLAATWIQLGVAGLVARLFTYHRIYDDLLTLPAIVAVFLCAKEAPGPRRTAAEMLFWVGLVGAMGPARFHADPRWAGFYGAAQTTIWCLLLTYLLWVAGSMRSGTTPSHAGPPSSRARA